MVCLMGLVFHVLRSDFTGMLLLENGLFLNVFSCPYLVTFTCLCFCGIFVY